MRLFRASAVAALALAIFFSSPLAPFARGVLAGIFAPRAKDAELAGMSKNALVARIESDEAALARVNYQAALYALLLDENAKLRALANAAPLGRGVLARVLARPPRSLYDTLVVDRGSAEGVAVGDLAIFEGIALGKVASTGTGTAVVALFSSPGAAADAVLGTPQGVVVARGMGGGAFELSLPRGVLVAPGDPIRYPSSRSLLLATVAGVAVLPDSSQTVYARSPISFADLDFIELIPANP